MTKKIGFGLLILVVCGFLGYQALQADSPLTSPSAQGQMANSRNQLPPPAKLAEINTLSRTSDAPFAGKNTEPLNPEIVNKPEPPVSGLQTGQEDGPARKAEIEQQEADALSALARSQNGEQLTDYEKSQLEQYLAEHNRGSENPLDYTGGPDAGSYYYVDNVAPDTAFYDWIELRGDANATFINSWTSHDDGYSYVGASSPGARHPIGFSFPFYGVNQDSFRLCSNGFLQFTTTSTSLSNSALPSTGVGGPAIFAYWDDLNLDRNGQTTNQVMYRSFGTYTVIEYDSIGVYNTSCGSGGATNTLKFEIMLFTDGKIKLQYNMVNVCNAQDSSMTVGIQSNGVAGSAALQYGYGAGGQTLVGHLPTSGLAIWFYQYFYPHNFATTSISSPGSSTYPGNTSVAVTARFTNFGTTTESSPVKYSFNGGPVVEEATASLAQNAFEDHTFLTPFTTPNVGGTYVLTVYTDLAGDGFRSNDTLRKNVVVCAPIPLPFAEGFESTTGTALPGCWAVGEFGSDNDARVWAGTSSNAHSGSRAAYCTYSSSSVIPNDWLFTPPFTLTAGNGYVLDFWYREYLVSSTYFDSVRVVLTTATNDASTVLTVMPTARASSATYVEAGGTFTPPATGDYYLAFVYTGTANAGGVVIDDVALTAGGTCQAPTVSVADSAGIGTVTMACVATGGFGGPIVYQWYTGQTCTQANAIPGATNSTYATSVSGNFACRAYRADSVNCAGCDWGAATVTPAPPGYDCSNPILLVGARDSLTMSSCNMGDNSPGQSCGSSGSDVVFHYSVPDGYNLTIWQSSNTFDSRHSLRWGGACPGANVVNCIDDPDTQPITWQNCTGATQDAYIVIGTWSLSSPCGTFTLQWDLQPNAFCPDITCSPTFTESEGNGGCGGDGLFNAVSCGDVISGTITANALTRDVDAFSFVLTDTSNLTLTALSEFDAILELRRGDGCPDVLVSTINDLGTCLGETRTFTCLLPATYHVTITAPFAETCGPQNYCLTIDCGACTPPPGEFCTNPIVAAQPNPNDSTVVTGTTASYAANNPDTCEYISYGPDLFYSLTLTSCRRITMKLEDTAGGSGDMHLSVYENDRCGTLAILCNDDKGYFDPIWWETPGQRGPGNFSSFLGGELSAGTYYIRVARYGSSSGAYRLVIFDNGPCSCDIACQAGDQIETAEDRYGANFPVSDPDGGCNSNPNVFGTIGIGQTVCGIGFDYLSHSSSTVIDYFRDTDWYQFSVAFADTIHWAVSAEFRATIGLASTTCPSPGFIVADTAGACTTKTVATYLSPGDYVAFVAPTRFVGNPLPSDYRATLSGTGGCVPDTVTDLTVYRDAALSNNVTLRWTADQAFPGTYTVYANNLFDANFPGTWVLLASGITPAQAQYVDTGAIGANAKRFYLVVGVCNPAAPASIGKGPTATNGRTRN